MRIAAANRIEPDNRRLSPTAEHPFGASSADCRSPTLHLDFPGHASRAEAIGPCLYILEGLLCEFAPTHTRNTAGTRRFHRQDQPINPRARAVLTRHDEGGGHGAPSLSID